MRQTLLSNRFVYILSGLCKFTVGMIDVTKQSEHDLNSFDFIGFASGIYTYGIKCNFYITAIQSVALQKTKLRCCVTYGNRCVTFADRLPKMKA